MVTVRPSPTCALCSQLKLLEPPPPLNDTRRARCYAPKFHQEFSSAGTDELVFTCASARPRAPPPLLPRASTSARDQRTARIVLPATTHTHCRRWAGSITRSTDRLDCTAYGCREPCVAQFSLSMPRGVRLLALSWACLLATGMCANTRSRRRRQKAAPPASTCKVGPPHYY